MTEELKRKLAEDAPLRLDKDEADELNFLYDEFTKRRNEDGGEWPEYTGDGE